MKGTRRRIVETAIAAAEQVEEAQADVEEPQPLEEIIGDKGCHSNQSMVDLEAVGILSYIAQPESRTTRLVGGARSPSACVSQSSADSRGPWTPIDATTGRAGRAFVCAPL